MYFWIHLCLQNKCGKPELRQHLLAAGGGVSPSGTWTEPEEQKGTLVAGRSHQKQTTTRNRSMGENQDCAVSLLESKASYVLSNVAEVVERILTFVPTKSLLQIAR